MITADDLARLNAPRTVMISRQAFEELEMALQADERFTTDLNSLVLYTPVSKKLTITWRRGS